MMINKSYKFWLIIIIFSISGFTGLIYESVWSHYLKLFLGHAAYAQALVLAIFMGGLAFGSWFAASRSDKHSNLLLLYAFAEGIIGVFGLFFHQVFEFVLQFSYSTVLPGLEPGWVHTYKWFMGSLLILPQSFLLGTTFPLLSNGLLRRYQQAAGWTISMLYFSNSIGAAIGVLISGFVLIKQVGLPGTILTAAVINILLALFVYLLAKTGQEKPCFHARLSSKDPLPVIFLIAAFLTGAASFIYEISWIRMLSMVLGASTHSFELMLSAFITGLALGGFWIRKRIDTVSDPIALAAGVQIIMGLLAMSTIPLYNFTYEVMSVVLSALDRTNTGYFFYSLTGHAICLFIMLPTTICAGMTFPLFTTILLRNNYGERSIGFVYSANTLGAIAGVFFTIFVGLPLLGLKGSIVLGGGIDIVLGFALLVILVKNIPVFKTAINLVLCTGVLSATYFLADIDKNRVISAVYRTGTSLFQQAREIMYYRDGKTATISVTRLENDNVVIATNGKPDASIIMKPDTDVPSQDEITMVMAGALPISINPGIKLVANIGMGSGLTSQVLLEWPGIEQLDTIEIEAAMVEGARHFLPRVSNVYNDPRSKIHIEDAKTFFSLHQNKYDLIVSEPSNPWVSGTSSLFTREFYRDIKRYLNDDGMLVQWLQVYELETGLLISVIKSLHEHFPYFDIYATDNSNLLVIARQNKNNRPLDTIVFKTKGFRDELNHVGLISLQDFKSRYLGNEEILGPLAKNYAIPPNSDYFPVLDLNAERSRYLRLNAKELVEYRTMPLPLINMLQHDYYDEAHTSVSDSQLHTFSHLSYRASRIYETFTNKVPGNEGELTDNMAASLYVLKNPPEECSSAEYETIWINSIYRLILKTLPYLQPGELKDMIEIIKQDCTEKMSVEQLQWLVLFNALADRNISLARHTAEELLSRDIQWQISQQRFLFSTILLCSILQMDYSNAIETWNRHINQLYRNINIPFEVLLLQSLIKKP